VSFLVYHAVMTENEKLHLELVQMKHKLRDKEHLRRKYFSQLQELKGRVRSIHEMYSEKVEELTLENENLEKLVALWKSRCEALEAQYNVEGGREELPDKPIHNVEVH